MQETANIVYSSVTGQQKLKPGEVLQLINISLIFLIDIGQ
jgi:hypothetical protein